MPSAMNLNYASTARCEELFAQRIDRYAVADQSLCKYGIRDIVERHDNA
jgi:hypothetical protein